MAQVALCGTLLTGVGYAYGLPLPAAFIAGMGFVVAALECRTRRLGFAHHAERQQRQVGRDGRFAFTRNNDAGGRRRIGGSSHRRKSDCSGEREGKRCLVMKISLVCDPVAKLA